MPPDRLQLSDQLCFALYAATNAVTRSYRPLLKSIGLTYPQYLVMLVLWQHGASSSSEIAERLSLPANGLSPLLDRLEDCGWVARTRDAQDRRIVRVAPTEAGLALETAAAQVQRSVVCATGLSVAALDDLRGELHLLVAHMEADTAAGEVADVELTSRRLEVS